MDVPDVLEVKRVVFMDFTWHSMNPFDFGYWADEVIWLMSCNDRNVASVSKEKGICCLWKISLGHVGISTLVAS